MIAIIDYGVGNLFSLTASLSHLGIENIITKEKKVIENASHIILPGVGAFGDASKQLKETGLGEIVVAQASKKPLMGICLGMQLLFEKSYEFGSHQGLGLISGEVVPLEDDLKAPLKVPHMGWNPLKFQQNSELFTHITEGDAVYFVHSFYAKTEKSNISSTAEYSFDVTASVERDLVYGCQFHPEKSGKVGLNILKAFSEIKN